MKITVLPGDGIGKEVTAEAIRVLEDVCSIYGETLATDTKLIGGAAIRENGSPLPDETLAACLDSDAVLLGAVGSPEFDDLPPSERPEVCLLKIRRALGGYANLRPAKAVPALLDSSPLRREIFENTDLLIVRELLGGIYYGEPRAVNAEIGEAFNTMRYSVGEIERVARVAFKAALGRSKKVTSVDKANVLETSHLWRQTVTRIAAEYPSVEIEHILVDACAMHLVTNPRRFDVILTENLFGDILSDEASVLTGSMGMLGSATIGGTVDFYEPVHGSAPDIEGRNIANPVGAIASAAMLLRYTLKNEAAARTIEQAIERVLDDGFRTIDLADKNYPKLVTTSEMGKLVSQYAVENANVAYAYHAV